MSGGYIAIDWGTTNRRAWRMSAAGEAEASLKDGRGILSLTPDAYPAEISAIRAQLGALPVIAAGMVGSNRGWREVPYVDAPAGVDALAAGCVTIKHAAAVLVPGVALRGAARADVMRGE